MREEQMVGESNDLQSKSSDRTTEKKTFGQKVFDNIFILLALGMAFPGVFYLGWGIIEIFVLNNTKLVDYLGASNQKFLLPGK